MNEELTSTDVAAAQSWGGRLRRWSIALGVALLALVLAAVTAVFGLILLDDASRSGMIPAGVSVEGVPIGGLEPSEATQLLLDELGAPITERSLVVRADDAVYRLDVSEIVSVEASRVAADARSLASGTSLLDRIIWRVLDTGLEIDLPLRIEYDDTRVSDWLADVASQVDTAAVDANRRFDVYEGVFEVVEAKTGRVLDQHAASLDVRDAILGGFSDVTLPVEIIEPSTDGENLGLAIHVDLSERRLRLYDGASLVKEYGVAIGAAGFGTPRGEWSIIQKRYMPSWGNPGSPWAASMPAYIPPGPSNPLGTRALNLNASGIRIHGTTQNWSIGSAASHGCMRMHRWDIEDLYERVDVGTPVIITS